MGSAEVIVLDTHVAIWSAFDTASLGKKCRRILRQASADNELAISAVSFWEIALLVVKRRLRLAGSAREARRLILDAGTTELPLTGEVAILAGELDGLHGDPADRFIAATAIIHDATLLTADGTLLNWRHPLRRHNAEV
jgi:PIN domain nuclease of toxin-antitoxin system